ncbi:MAG: hypothetical protein ACREFH_14350, partial [Stellaceae bacterium]
TSVSGNRDGILVYDNGFAIVSVGATVANNSGVGVLVIQGGFAKVNQGGIVRGNGGNGIDVENGNVTIGDGSGPALIESNKENGLFMRTNSVANFGNAATKITGNTLFGIFCAAAPASLLLNGGPIGTVSGNTAGQIHCNTSP